MKKILMALALAATMFAAQNAAAQTFDYGTLVYSVIAGTNNVRVGDNSMDYGNGLVAGYSYRGAVTIPATVRNGRTAYAVTEIGQSAFAGCSGLTSVAVPNSVTTIGYAAFWNCRGLISVAVGHSVTTIGTMAFAGCSGLTSVTVGHSVTTIGTMAFADCVGLTSVAVPNSVTTIGYAAFAGCSGLVSVIIPNSVTTVGDRAFEYCSGLISVIVGNSVATIGYATFAGCVELTSVTVGHSVAAVDEWAFRFCSGLTEITSFAVNPPYLVRDVFSYVDKTIPVHVPCGSETAYQAAYGWDEFTDYTECVTTGLNVNVYPNPANDRIFIEGEDFDKVVIVDILGREAVRHNGGKEINISSLPNGVYGVRVIADNKTIATRKIIKK
ncbi:MAG: leucine-rich repeat protein [Prevotellaceae bacterium]|jgi:hypothetical protein|nr:leucine-rich repeat protein [Prevotellaceae bacterium]